MKKIFLLGLTLAFLISGCENTSSSSSSSESSSETPSDVSIYTPEDIARFGSATPAGVANYHSENDTVVIWNTDASLDNYGGVQTPTLSLDFSKAVFFEMDVKSCYSQYILKLAVEGESETFYVLADDGTPGLISVNVVDAMLSDKFRAKRTEPDPGYDHGWIYANQTKKCAFHILAKGPDGERQTAELVLGSIKISNNQTAVTGVSITSSEIVGNTLQKLKNSASVTLTAALAPSTIEDQRILWSSQDESIATVSESGVVNFIGVGRTTVTAKSRIDQSKTASVTIDVTSGYESVASLKTQLASLAYDGTSTSLASFDDLFRTTWNSDITQSVTLESLVALDDHRENGKVIIENYFDPAQSAQVSEAQSRLNQGKAYASMTLTGSGTATVYRDIDGKLYQTAYNGNLPVQYASYSSSWSVLPTYEERSIVVWANGDVRKFDLHVLSADALGNYAPNDFMNTSLWTVPDRTRQNEDSVVHALSPASISVASNQLVMKQNKYPEAKYCFGGIVSNVFTVQSAQTVQMLLDIASLNQMSDYVKTMWEIKILYYQSNKTTAVSANPIKVDSGNTNGLKTVTFTPAYANFRIYLVVNGSDIGAQFANAEMRLDSFKLYALD